MPGKRLKVFYLTTLQMAQGFDHSAPPHINLVGLPEDARIEHVEHDGWLDAFKFIVSHPGWPEVPPGQQPPTLTVHLAPIE